MQSALRLTARVKPGNKIEITVPELTEGDSVEIILMLPEKFVASRPSALDIIRSLKGHRLFQSPDEVDCYLQRERNSWDR